MKEKLAQDRKHDPQALVQRPEYINARWLLENEAEGLYQRFAEIIGRHPQQVGAMINKKPSRTIGNKLARVIEAAFNRPENWLSEVHDLSLLKPQLASSRMRNSDYGRQKGSLSAYMYSRPSMTEEDIASGLNQLTDRLRASQIENDVKPSHILFKAPADLFGTSQLGLELTDLLNSSVALLTLHGVEIPRHLKEEKGGTTVVAAYERVKHTLITSPGGSTHWESHDSFNESVLNRFPRYYEDSKYVLAALIEHIFIEKGKEQVHHFEIFFIGPRTSVSKWRKEIISQAAETHARITMPREESFSEVLRRELDKRKSKGLPPPRFHYRDV